MVPAFFWKAMILFNCDYSEGAHADILRRLAETNMEQTAGYGEDPYCGQARELIAGLCGRTDLDIHFLIGGTQTNFTVIAAALRPHQCVLCADTGHINVHESGAVEACGHKVSAIPSPDGKLAARQIEEAWHAHWDDETHEHMPQPKMVYLSHPTELGTIYSRKELEEISGTCRRLGLYLYLDGARLGYGLAAVGADVVFECAGNMNSLTNCINYCIKPGGQIAVIGTIQEPMGNLVPGGFSIHEPELKFTFVYTADEVRM